jgi:hypothetical protein
VSVCEGRLGPGVTTVGDGIGDGVGVELGWGVGIGMAVFVARASSTRFLAGVGVTAGAPGLQQTMSKTDTVNMGAKLRPRRRLRILLPDVCPLNHKAFIKQPAPLRIQAIILQNATEDKVSLVFLATN